MVDGIPVDILNGGSILFFQNADISILSEMFRWTVNLRIYLATLFFQRCVFGDGDGERVDDGRNNTLDMCIYYCFLITEC
jgi:hypothetical protein